ncbi:MAG: hydrolase [Alphaproteobacteria bacterium]|nr:hydrolase [Alphaproteobacteria bacterium]
MLIRKIDSCLLIIDVQERLAPAMNEPRRIIDGCARLLKGAGILGIPTLITEQYPKGLGPSLFDIREAAPETAIYFEKTNLSAVQENDFMDRLTSLGKKQVVIAGIEEHICVLQTAVELKEAGFDVFVVTDASGCRAPENEQAAIRRLTQEGIFTAGVEMVLFEWLRKAGSPEFKEIQNRLIK